MADGGCLRTPLSRPDPPAGAGKKRLEARCKWHFGGGPEYCGACADAGLPCSKGKPNENGELCPYCANEPQTMEGWEAWDIALRCLGQLRMSQFVVLGIDVAAALKLAESLGYDLACVSELISGCENGMVAALNEKLKTSAQEM